MIAIVKLKIKFIYHLEKALESKSIKSKDKIHNKIFLVSMLWMLIKLRINWISKMKVNFLIFNLLNRDKE